MDAQRILERLEAMVGVINEMTEDLKAARVRKAGVVFEEGDAIRNEIEGGEEVVSDVGVAPGWLGRQFRGLAKRLEHAYDLRYSEDYPARMAALIKDFNAHVRKIQSWEIATVNQILNGVTKVSGFRSGNVFGAACAMIAYLDGCETHGAFSSLAADLRKEIEEAREVARIVQKAMREEIDQAGRGLYPKFTVTRNDGRDLFDGDRAGADYFVLDVTYDHHALAALVAYARSCAGQYPRLAYDLFKKAHEEKADYDAVEKVLAANRGCTHDGGPCYEECPVCHPERWTSEYIYDPYGFRKAADGMARIDARRADEAIAEIEAEKAMPEGYHEERGEDLPL